MREYPGVRSVIRFVAFYLLPWFFLTLPQIVLAQKVTNEFFPLHNIIRGDSTYNTFDKQVELIKKTGYDGIEINQLDSFEGMKDALDKHKFKGSYFYVKLNVDEPYIDQRLKGYINRLKGSGIVIAPFIVSDSKKYKEPAPQADSLVIDMLDQIGGWAEDVGLQVAIYPHYGFYVQRIGHSLDLVKKVNRKNVGISFNLCHWLATTTASEREKLRPDLKALSPYLKLVTICGANNVLTAKQNVWDDYILPLGSGNFDTYGLVSYLIRDLDYKGAIGVQCYNIKIPKIALVKNSIKVWQGYKSRLENEK